MKTFWIFLAVILSIHSQSTAQNIKLTNINDGRELILAEGMRVGYTLSDQSGLKIGELEKVFKDSIVVESKSVLLLNLDSIGKKKKGSGFWAFLSSALGGSMIGVALAPEPDPCPSCQTVIVEDRGGTVGDVILVAGGVALITVGLRTAIKNSQRNIRDGNWKLTVTD